MENPRGGGVGKTCVVAGSVNKEGQSFIKSISLQREPSDPRPLQKGRAFRPLQNCPRLDKRLDAPTLAYP